MVKCSFTGKEEHAFKGIHLIKNDGSIEYYSSSKAMKNALKLKRDKRKLKWTEAYRIEKEKARAKKMI
ncbi:MAG: 50S ribosomal protein L24 [Nanoarchaeota archaeon]